MAERVARSATSTPSQTEASARLAPALVDYLADSYPHNHGYRVVDGRLRPKFQLWWRLRSIVPLYPRPLTSLLDLSCCKGYFVIAAAQESTCERALGIDVHRPDLDACEQVAAAVGATRARFAQMHLHELAERIDEFGGPFQTVLLVNAYQYFFFGSGRSPVCYPDHDRLFGYLRRICSGRLVFNNRMEFERVRGLGRRIGSENAALAGHYSSARILDAAARHFEATRHGRLGRNPLWTFDARR